MSAFNASVAQKPAERWISRLPAHSRVQLVKGLHGGQAACTQLLHPGTADQVPPWGSTTSSVFKMSTSVLLQLCCGHKQVPRPALKLRRSALVDREQVLWV